MRHCALVRWGCGRTSRTPPSGAALHVCIAIVEAGLDLTIGDLHVCQPGRDSFVYDLMEPDRRQVDREVLAFAGSEVFTARDFEIDSKRVCRLHPELARTVAGVLSTGDTPRLPEAIAIAVDAFIH